MRRFVALILLCVFSLQACWAAAASYCQHETAPAAAHVGHHAHQHQADGPDHAGIDTPDTPDAPGTPGTLVPDLDCHACHACHACITPDLQALACASAVTPPPQRITGELPAPPLARVERPDWQTLA